MKLDLSNFKKVAQEKHHTILESEGGHQIKVAHKGLSKDFMSDLDGLPLHQAKGGKVNSNSSNNPPKEARNNFTEPKQIGTNYLPTKDPVLLAMPRPISQPGPIEKEKDILPPCLNPSCKSYGKGHPNCNCYGGKTYSTFSDGGEVDSFCSQDRAHDPSCEYYQDGGDVGHGASGSWGSPDEIPQMPVVVDPQGNAVDSQPQEQASTPVATASTTQDLTQPVADTTHTEVPQTPMQRFQQEKQRHLNDILPESAAITSDLNSGNINPKTYHDLFAKKDTLGKIGTLFGLMLGGAGSGLTGQPNAVMEMMKQELNNDFEAQQKNQTNRKDLLKINQEALMAKAGSKNLTAEANLKANALTRIQQNNFALHHLVQMANKLPPGSPDRIKADQQLAMMNAGVQNENFNIADRAATASAFFNTMMPQSQGIGSEADFQKQQLMRKMTGPEGQKMAEDIETKHVPGVPGVASRPVQEHDRQQIQAMGVLDNKADDLLGFIKQHRGSLNPQQRAVAAQKAEEMVNYYNNSIQGGVLTEGRLDWLDKQINKNPLSIVNDLLGNSARLNEIKTSNANRKNMLLKGYGFPVQDTKQQETIERFDPKSGKTVLFDAQTKKPLRFK